MAKKIPGYVGMRPPNVKEKPKTGKRGARQSKKEATKLRKHTKKLGLPKSQQKRMSKAGKSGMKRSGLKKTGF